MLNQDDYVKQQESLLEQFKNADAIKQRIIATDIAILHMLKEDKSQRYELDKILQNVPANNISGMAMTKKPNKGLETQYATVSTELYTKKNIFERGTFVDAKGDEVNLKALLQNHPEALQKICDAINTMTEDEIRNNAKKAGLAVEKQIKGNKVDFKLSVDLNSPLDTNHIKSIEKELEAMKKESSTATKTAPMSALPNTADHHVTQDMRTAIRSEREDTSEQEVSNDSDKVRLK